MLKKYALIIGIENYPDTSGLSNVSYAINDAWEMADYARQAGFHLINGKPLLDEEASYGQVIRQLRFLFYYTKPEDFIFLYYAGHGYYSEDGGYLIPFDYPKEHDIDEHCSISFDSINRRFKNKKTKRFLFFLDTCHSGFAGGQLDIRSALSVNITVSLQIENKIESQMEDMLQKNEFSKNVGRVIFTSSAPTERSHSIEEFKHGLFTYHLLSGLKVRKGKKTVNVKKLISRVEENVLRHCLIHNLKQTPKAFTNIQGKFLIPGYKVKRKVKKEDKRIDSVSDFHILKKAEKKLKSGNLNYDTQIIDEISKEDRSDVEAKPIKTIKIAQEKFDINRRMPERTIEELENKIEEFRNLQGEYPRILKEEIDIELMRLTSIIEIHNIWQLEERTLPELSKKLDLLEGIDKEKYSSVNYNIAEKIASIISKIDHLKLEVWNKKYNNYNWISVSIYIVLNSLLSLFVIRNYFVKGGIMNILGVVLFGVFTSIFLFMAGKWGLRNTKYSKRDKKINRFISLEFAKIFITSSLTCAACLNILVSPDEFLSGYSFLFPIAVALNIRAFLELGKVELKNPDESNEAPPREVEAHLP